MFQIDLQWLAFPVNLQAVETWMRANAGSDYSGNSADKDLTLWFANEPSDEIKSAIEAYWSGLTSESPEATSYQTFAQIESAAASAKAANVASATTKLKALGLSDAEVAAIVGQ